MVFLENQDMVLNGQTDNAFILVASHVINHSLYKYLLQALNGLNSCIVFPLSGTMKYLPLAGYIRALCSGCDRHITPRSMPLRLPDFQSE